MKARFTSLPSFFPFGETPPFHCHGFTLIELLAVIGDHRRSRGDLIPTVVAHARGEQRRRLASVQSMGGAIEQFRQGTGLSAFPATSQSVGTSNAPSAGQLFHDVLAGRWRDWSRCRECLRAAIGRASPEAQNTRDVNAFHGERRFSRRRTPTRRARTGHDALGNTDIAGLVLKSRRRDQPLDYAS